MGRPKLNKDKVQANKEYLNFRSTQNHCLSKNTRRHTVVGIRVENQTLVEMRSTCALCLHKYENSNEVEDWLKCPICLQWFQEIYFGL